jgi:hypothetical protein
MVIGVEVLVVMVVVVFVRGDGRGAAEELKNEWRVGGNLWRVGGLTKIDSNFFNVKSQKINVKKILALDFYFSHLFILFGTGWPRSRRRIKN